MVRRAFIVGAPLSYEAPVFYSGVKSDLQSYYNLFTSPTGGAHVRTEIVYLENPSWSKLKRALSENPAHFSTFVFSGHGATGLTSQDTYIDINAYEKVALADVIKNIRAAKKLVITDSCRNYIDDRMYGLLGDVHSPPLIPVTFPSHLEFMTARKVFDNAVRQASNGVQVLYSCSAGEKSLINSNGSHYSKSLLLSTKQWSVKIAPRSVLLGTGAHNLSSTYITKYGKRQNPKTQRSHETVNFPFALRLGTELL